jgi:serine/threonine protein kinase
MKICGNNNENSVRYYESYQNEKEFAIIMELCHTNLSKFLKVKKKFELDELYEILNQLNNTFKVMKENSIVHRDLKTNNILITFDDNNWALHLNNLEKYKDKLKFKIKLCDYGKSKIGKLNSLTILTIGTHFYIAPEILELAEENKEENNMITNAIYGVWG